MKVFDGRLRFNTPAFLGDANQRSAWRTPPIKALLRQFWRMDYARRAGWEVDLGRMRAAEGALFGTAGDQNHSRQSRIRLRLDPEVRSNRLVPGWRAGTLTSWTGLEAAPILPAAGKQRTSPHAYLGFGPLDARGGTRLGDKCNAAIQADDSVRLRIGVASEEPETSDQIARALALANHFGTLGGRSRNGWGSLALESGMVPAMVAAQIPLRDWRDALELDWPHALGSDDAGPLLWAAAAAPDWRQAMRQLAQVRLDLRSAFRISGSASTETPSPGHWLAYPITRHGLRSWGNKRLPNSLRFKVTATADGKLRPLVLHMPCMPPAGLRPDRAEIEAVWNRAHGLLDGMPGLQRLAVEELA